MARETCPTCFGAGTLQDRSNPIHEGNFVRYPTKTCSRCGGMGTIYVEDKKSSSVQASTNGGGTCLLLFLFLSGVIATLFGVSSYLILDYILS